MSWECESDWDDGEEILQESSGLLLVLDPHQPKCGKLLRDQGYAETMAAAGDYRLLEDGSWF